MVVDRHIPKHKPECKQILYHPKFDAWYCKECDVWLEMVCSDGTCEFCKDRSNRPNEVKAEKGENVETSNIFFAQ